MDGLTRKVPKRRSLASHQAIVEAASQLLVENGYCSVTIDQIASRAGVGKQTIYRWWASKIEIYIELYEKIALQNFREIKSNSLSEDLNLYSSALLEQLTHPVAGLAFRGIVAEAQNSQQGLLLFQTFMFKRFELTRNMIQRAIDRKEIKPTTDCDLISSIVGGAAVWRALLGKPPLTAEFLAEICQTALHGLLK